MDNQFIEDTKKRQRYGLKKEEQKAYESIIDFLFKMRLRGKEKARQLDEFDYYGRGPINNYPDRKTSQFVGWYHSAVSDMGIMLPKPQAQGNREEVRWCAVTGGDKQGVAFVADGVMSASALPWSQQET